MRPRRLPAPARWLKPRATQCEGRLRSLIQPTKVGLVAKSRLLQPAPAGDVASALGR
ncbi:MAG: hypothetical protein WCG26_00065 [Chloroflexales bacterium]